MAFFKRKKKKKKNEAPQTSDPAPAASENSDATPGEPEAVADPPRESGPGAPAAEQDGVGAAPGPAEQASEDASPAPEPEAAEEQADKPPDQATPVVEGEPPSPEPEKEAGDEERAEPERKGLFGRMKQRLGKTRDKISGSIDRITFGKQIDEDTLDELEEVLVTADLGVTTAMELIEGLRGKVKRKELADAQALKNALQQGISDILDQAGREPIDRKANNPHVIMVVGVNGVGKTTTIGKLAHHFGREGRQVLLAAGDTFRAAAAEQLAVWSERTGAPLVRQQHGADPSAVAFDAVDAAINRGRDLLLIDTAGRLHTKVNLMEELKKMHRVVGKRLEGAPHEVILVLDATTGQNALSQARLFNEAVKLSGVILTKLDGTAKGGIVVAIAAELKLPIRYVGLGEGLEDLRPFDPEAFAQAIF